MRDIRPTHTGRECLARQHWAIITKRTRKEGGGYREEDIPVHLQCIISIEDTPEEPITLDLGYSINSKGYYFLANTIDRELKEKGRNKEWGNEWNFGTLAENNQTLIHMAAKKTVKYTLPAIAARARTTVKTRDAVIIVGVGAIKRGVVGVLDPNCQETNENYYFFIRNHNQWANLFINSARHEMRGQQLEVMEHEEQSVDGEDSSGDDY